MLRLDTKWFACNLSSSQSADTILLFNFKDKTRTFTKFGLVFVLVAI